MVKFRPHPTATANEDTMNIVTKTSPQGVAIEYIEYSPAATDRQLVMYRLELEFGIAARNRNAKPAPLRAPGGDL